MPIWNNEKDKVLMIEVGFGDVEFAHGKKRDADYPDELMFVAGPEGEIGRENPEEVGKSSVEVGAACRIVFHKRASLDVLIERLTALRALMPADKSPEPHGP